MPLTPTRVQRIVPKALYFDGEDDYVEVPHSGELMPTSITVEVFAYVCTEGSDHDQWLVGKKVSSWDDNGYVLMYGWGSDIYFTIGERPNYVMYDLSDYAFGMWHHIVGVYDASSGEIRLFIDGILRKSRTAEHGLIANTEPVRISHPSAFRLNSYIGFVRIYNRALTEDEIKHNYYYPDNPVTDGLVLWLHWDTIDIGTSTWKDKSGYGNNGTIYGASEVQIVKTPTRVLSPTRILTPTR